MKALEVLTFIGGAIGAIFLLATFGANGAPQEAAGAAMAVAFVVIPYCICATVQRRVLINQGRSSSDHSGRS